MAKNARFDPHALKYDDNFGGGQKYSCFENTFDKRTT